MGKLLVDRINNLSSFKEIRNDWEQLYKSDPNSHIYISWLWQYNWFSTTSYKWVVLGVKNVDTSSYIAFLPLTIYNRGSFGIYPIRRIVFGGKPISIYSGFLCSPDSEFEAISLLAAFIQSNLKWDTLHFTWFIDSRVDIFLDAFPNTKYSVKVGKSLTSLCVTLPDDYQTFLKHYLRKDTRRTIMRKTKIIQQNENYNIRYSTARTIDRDIDTFCKLWLSKWKKQLEAERYSNTLHYFFKNDLLKLSILWDGELAVSGQACLLDPANSIYTAYCTSYNTDYFKISPGILMVADSIKLAIEQNYKYFDFTVGLDPYKLSFGPKQYPTKDVSIQRKRIKTVVTLMVMKQMKSVFRKLLK